MAEETLTTAAPATTTTAAAEEVVVVSDVPVAEKPTETVPATVEEKKPAEESATAAVEADDKKIATSVSFQEETNVAGELPDPEKKALDELKQLVQEALNKHELSAPPPPPPPAKEEEKPAAAAEPAAAAKDPKAEEKKVEETLPPPLSEETAAAEKKVEETPPPPPPAEEAAATEKKAEEIPPAASAEVPAPPAAAKETPVAVISEVVVEAATTIVKDDGAKTVKAIEETIVAAAAPAEPAPAAEAPAVEEPKEEVIAPSAEEPAPPLEPEEISIWGIPLLADEKSDVVLLKFLRARDFKVKEAFTMLRNTFRWRKEFKIDTLLEEDLGTELDKVVYISGVDKEGHPVCYNVYGEFQNKELYTSTFADAEKPDKFLRWRVQFLEKTIRKDIDFSPDGISTFMQVNDLKASPGPFKRELKVATNQAVQLLQDNYPEFVAKQVFINVPWWYLAFYRMISPFFTQRTKSKFVFAGPSKSAETLFKYIAPEQVPVQYGGLKKDSEEEFTTADIATEEIIKPSTKSTIEFPTSEASTLAWEARVIGWDVSYGAEFVPSVEGGYTVIIQKPSKISVADETVLSGSYKAGEAGKVVLTFDNSTSSKKKKLLYRSKTKPSENQ